MALVSGAQIILSRLTSGYAEELDTTIANLDEIYLEIKTIEKTISADVPKVPVDDPIEITEVVGKLKAGGRFIQTNVL